MSTAPIAAPALGWRRRHRLLFSLAWGMAALSVPPLASAAPTPSSVILRDLYNFDELGSVLYVAAHPDDENTQLIAYLAGGRHYRTAYLSLTRGDGGQNVLGPQFGDELGVIRTEELLAARRIDGGRQYFSRAVDFGFSKDYRETLRIWDKQEVLSDMVRVIREFRPDVVITRFSPVPGGTHGHHTASTVLALEAFKVCGDPKAFPDQLPEGLMPWQPKRLLWNMGGFQRSGNVSNVIRMDVGGNDSVSGESFAEIAARSRSMHKTQGFGNFTGFGGGSGPRSESFELLDGEPATNDIMDGVDTTWSRVPGGAEIGTSVDEVIAKFNQQDPAASVPALLEIKKGLAGLADDDPVVGEKRRQLDHVIQECLGLTVETTIPQAEVVPGETLNLHLTAVLRSGVVPVRWVAARYPAIKTKFAVGADLSTNQAVSRDSTETLPADTPLSQPYWLREDHTAGMFRVDDPNLIGRPENPPVFPVEQVFDVDGQTVIVPDQPVQVAANRVEGETRNLDVISPVSLKLAADVSLFAPKARRPVTVEVTAARSHIIGTLRLDTPAGWKVSPVAQSFHLKAAGDKAQFTFKVTAPAKPTTANITAEAEVGGKTFDNERVVINYPHIPLLLLQPPARLKAVCLNLAIRGHNVGYLPGAGDDVAQCLADMGYKVTTLTGDDLTTNRLKEFDAVVIGVRAFNVRTDLVSHLPALFAYAKAGGNVIEQYNRPGRDLQTDQFTPYHLQLSNDRVTDETAAMTFLTPDHPVLNTPNKITSADFDGWIQERGIYYPNEWDDHFTPILACSDPGEAPLKGGLLVAKYGKGYFVYTGLVFFRQLPDGVPGAYRLFANLVSLGK
ncbi:MAG TPA: PIG-L family deacetylase [Candidatus Limnocylindrales bacterium]|nr:PIG-L family deacetylase [Candidatus Limnocylindrales bacterium]